MNYTSIEQSKKLVELGLNPETADMAWIDRPLRVTDCPDVPVIMDIELESMIPQNKLIPCWSLGALLELMPKKIPHRRCNEEGKEYWTYSWNLTSRAIYYGCGLVDYSLTYESFVSFDYKDNPIEAAYNMVVWLLENRYI